MVRSLWTAATGMNGQQANIDNISHNLSNVNTTGYKEVRTDFQDLIYQTHRMAGTPATEKTLTPVGNQIGLGVKVGATQKLFHQGSLKATDNPYDLAIEGQGFFQIKLYDGSQAYTRDGAFKLDANRQLVTSSGYRVEPEITLPDNFIPESLNVTEDGNVFVKVPGNKEPVFSGQINMYRFINPAGLQSLGENSFKETAASGIALEGTPSSEGMGRIHHKFLENSNVSIVKEMVNMIVAQRAYEMNSKAIQTSDTMLGIANNLKR